MKRIFSMVISLLSILLISGCSSVQEFHYQEEVAEVESEEVFDEVLETKLFEYSDVDFAITNDNKDSFIVRNDEISLYFIERSYSKYTIYFNTKYCGLCSFNMNIKYANGSEDYIDYQIINTSFQHYFVLELAGESIEDITIRLEPVDGEFSENYKFNDDTADKIELLSDNTIKSHINGVIEIYDKYATAIDVLEVKKGETYVVNSGATNFSIMCGR